jgi:organic radical activating enzyme
MQASNNDGSSMDSQRPFERICIEATNVCNMACSFCPNAQLPRKREVLGYRPFEELINNIVSRNLTKRISFTGTGEPTLDPFLPRRLNYCHKNGLRTQITTNGLRLKSIANYLDSIDILFISWQTASEKSFNLRNPYRWTYEAYVENILEFVEYVTTRIDSKPVIYISVISNSRLSTPTRKIISDLYPGLGEQDDRSLVEVASKIISVAPEKALISPREISNHINQGLRNDIRQFQLIDNIFLYCYQFFNWGGLLFDNMPNLSRKLTFTGKCQLFLEGPQILANGDVVFCCIDAFGSTTFGNIQMEELSNILDSESYKNAFTNFRKSVVNNSHCQRCLGEWRKRSLFGRWLRSFKDRYV